MPNDLHNLGWRALLFSGGALLLMAGCAPHIEPKAGAAEPAGSRNAAIGGPPVQASTANNAEPAPPHVRPDTVTTLPQPDAPAEYYEVTAGDTLDAVAARLKVSPAALAEANGIDNPNVLLPGQVLFVPRR